MDSSLRWIDGFLGISVIGWILVGMVYVPLTLVFVLLARRYGRQRPAVAALTAVVLFAPLLAGVAEAVYVDRRFKALCATAGLKINRVVSVEGFFYEAAGPGWEESVKAGKYRWVEWIQADPRGEKWFRRTELVAPGEVRRLSIPRPTARYVLHSPPFKSPYGHLVYRRKDAITDGLTGEVIAAHVIGYRYPAFIDGLWSQYMSGGPQICGDSGLITDALTGIDKRER